MLLEKVSGYSTVPKVTLINSLAKEGREIYLDQDQSCTRQAAGTHHVFARLQAVARAVASHD